MDRSPCSMVRIEAWGMGNGRALRVRVVRVVRGCVGVNFAVGPSDPSG